MESDDSSVFSIFFSLLVTSSENRSPSPGPAVPAFVSFVSFVVAFFILHSSSLLPCLVQGAKGSTITGTSPFTADWKNTTRWWSDSAALWAQ